MDDKIKVLHIITDLPIGGAQDNTLYTLELLDREKYEVSLACNMSGDFVKRASSIQECKIYDIDSLQRDVDLKKDIKSMLALIGIMRKNEFDIVHTHSTKPGVIGRLASYFSGIPVVIHTVHGFPFHDFMGSLKRQVYINIERIMNYLTSHLITVSTLNLKKIVDLGMAKEADITNIYSGIDIERFEHSQKKDMHAELNLDSSVRLIGFIGRFSDQKSPMTLLNAIVKVVEQISDCHFVFVGDGPLKEDMVSFVDQNDLQSQVSFLGYRLDVHEILHGLDLFALSSIYEGLGRSVTEALCCEIPVIATAVEGVPELVINKRTGLLVEPRNPQQLADAIIYALKNPAEMKIMAKAGNMFVKQNFQVTDMVDRIADVYSRMLLKLET